MQRVSKKAIRNLCESLKLDFIENKAFLKRGGQFIVYKEPQGRMPQYKDALFLSNSLKSIFYFLEAKLKEKLRKETQKEADLYVKQYLQKRAEAKERQKAFKQGKNYQPSFIF
ncbi:hypothetical protein [Helicobacter winghamensis]|uniref:hypothetical protein n=1 Tax=Helicobacter winghamensis TaxID=157268 RepID=UPI0001A27CDC|nr:hypothetical protein [Helicobacter winghamensis]EEO25886.1 hypothetical protein HWAG_00678 [Helicobacter winghamensis ATCC BAA-430]QOQ98583.1 hypothetical protein A0Z60_03145 [Helicobacter winghamensis]